MIVQETLNWGVPEFCCVSEADVQLIRQGWGTFSLFAKECQGGDYFQRSHNLNDFYEKINDFMLLEGYDLYITQNVFRSFNRRELLVHKLCACYVDLDFYHDTNLSPEQMADRVLEHCEKNRIPFPSAIICSGRGLYLKWYLKHSAPANALPKWNLIQESLVDAFEPLGVDRRARDASRVLRPIGSWNSKAGRFVEPLWMLRDSESATAWQYSLRELGDAMLPLTEAEYLSMKRGGELDEFEARLRYEAKNRDVVELERVAREGFHAMIYSFAMRGRNVHDDFCKLIELRGWDKTGIPDGQRNDFVLWFCVHAFLSMMGGPQNHLYMEAASALNYLVPHWDYKKLRQKLSAVYKRVKAMNKGYSFANYGSKMYPLLYTPSNETLVDWLRITAEELVQLDYIRTEETRAAQTMRKRREAGMQSRNQYLSQFSERRLRVIELRERGLSWSQIGEVMGIHKKTAYDLYTRAIR